MTVRRTGLCILAGLALAGCGTQTSGGGGASSPAGTGSTPASPTGGATVTPAQTTPGQTTPAGPDRCHTSGLSASLGRPDAGAGNRYAVLSLTNTGTSPCVIFGYGGVQLLDAAGKPVPTRQVRDPQHKPLRVLLQPGGAADSTLHWSVVPSGSESTTGACQPTAAALLVTPPDETEPLKIAWNSGPVCQQGRIDQGAYAPAK